MTKRLVPNKLTKIFLSISSNPGTSGSKFYNQAFQIMNLNSIYIPIKLKSLKGFFDSIKLLKVSGCSVSMPFKQDVIKYLHKLDLISKKTNSVNTILIKKNYLYGYNTDYYGAKKVLEKIKKYKFKSALICGGGGVSRSLCCAIQNSGIKEIYITSRSDKKLKNWKNLPHFKMIKWVNRNKVKADLLVNATPLGMDNNKIYKNKIPISYSSINNFNCVFDVVVSKTYTPLVKLFKNNKKPFLIGSEMAFFQSVKQFEIYNKISPPIKKLQKNYF